MPNIKILIVDDEEGMWEVCADTLRRLPDVVILMEAERVSNWTHGWAAILDPGHSLSRRRGVSHVLLAPALQIHVRSQTLVG